ncbi:MAG TPA: hypothetical protein VG891_10055 [Rhizomicrobium sp.]|nr:hypothetical protein [Rhizomicrobium sp.]
MPMLQAFIHRLNQKFSVDEIKRTAKSAKMLAPGQPLNAGIVMRKGSVAYKPVQAYLESMPGVLAETLRSVMHYALTSTPPKPITFTWTPAYEFEVGVTELGCGIVVQVRGRYPRDKPPARGQD